MWRFAESLLKENQQTGVGVAGVEVGHSGVVVGHATTSVMQLCRPPALRRWENQRMLFSFVQFSVI